MEPTNRYLLIVLLVIIFLLLLCNKKEGFTSHPVFRMYYTDWCGYSQRALPEFEALGNEVNEVYRTIDSRSDRSTGFSRNARVE